MTGTYVWNGAYRLGRLGPMDGPGVYARNAAAMWASQAPWARVVPRTPPGLLVVHIPAQPTFRVILRERFAADPGHIGAILAQTSGRVVVEDAFGSLRLHAGDHVAIDRMPVMVKPAGAVPLTGIRPGVRVVQASTGSTLGQAEKVIVDGFPQPALQPYRPGRSLPPALHTVPGWRVWLAYHEGEPAAACCTYDDGTAVGVYWLATLRQHRSRGLGRAVMTAALTATQDRPATLVATAAGQPLYSSLGFHPVSTAAWYRKPGGTDPAWPGCP